MGISVSITKPVPAFLIAYSNSDFTNPHEVVLPGNPPECTGNYTHMGAKYWGLESRRHVATTLKGNAFIYDHEAHNWFQIGLKERVAVEKIAVSTKWFTGNQVRAVSVFLIDEMTGKETRVLDRAPLKPDAEHEFSVPPTLATEARVDCYYEGGISQVSFFGEKAAEQPPQRKNLLEDAVISYVSNAHYGKPEQAVRGARREMHMIGWESARTGFGEQALFGIKTPAKISEIVVDTYLHRLNAPLSCHVFGFNGQAPPMDAAPRWKLTLKNGKEIVPENFQEFMLEQKYLPEKNFTISLHLQPGSPWKAVLPFAPLMPDTYHRFNKLENTGPFSHLLYMHYPNGGIHGLKVF